MRTKTATRTRTRTRQQTRTRARILIRLAATLALLVPLTVVSVAGASAARPRPHGDLASDCALPTATGWTSEGHDTDYVQFQRPLGRIKVGVLFVDFPDAPATDSTSGYYDFLKPAANLMSDASYGRLSLTLTPVSAWLRMPQASTTYGFDRGITWDEQELYVAQAVAAAAPYTDVSKFDMLYIVPTKNATAITFSPTYLYDPSTPHIVVNGKELKWAITFGQDMYRWGPKVAIHESSHTFGAPDLYAFSGTDIFRYTGGFDLLGNILGAAPHHFGWEDWKFGWIGDTQVGCLASAGRMRVDLSALEVPGGKKIAVVRTGPTTAYVAESRRAVGLDANLCRTGVVVYKVDSSVQTGAGPVLVQDATPGSSTTSACPETVDDGAYQPGQTFTDAVAGVTISVDAAGTLDDTVTVTRS